MAKKVKFPLKMADDAQVRSIEELREHFDLASVLSYYDDGRLLEWLEDRYYEEEAAEIGTLDSSSPDFKKKLCDALGASYSEDADDVELADIAARNERRERLKQFTADDGILAAVDSVAFTQEDLGDLLDNGVNPIYLCGESFKISMRKKGVTYIGVNGPKADVANGYAKKGIVFQNVDLGSASPVNLDDNIKIATKTDENENRTEFFKATQEVSYSHFDMPQEMANRGVSDSLGAKRESQNAAPKRKALIESMEFRMTVEDISEIWGRGIVALGDIELGYIRLQDEVAIIDGKTKERKADSVVMGIEMYRRLVDNARQGDSVGLLLHNIDKKSIKDGDIIVRKG